MSTKGDIKTVIDRLDKLKGATDKNSVAVRTALIRIGVAVQARAKLNIKQQGLIDTGRLINSIAYQVGVNSVDIGSYAVPYAAVHEFGFSGTVNIPSHSRQIRGRKPHTVRAHTRRMNVRERPYLYPALRSLTKFILEQIRGIAKP